MTMILTAAGPTVVHVGDRRVTRIDPRGRSIHSPIENKSVIFLLKDAVGVLGYTGNAYVGTQTTDTWLAQLIAGTIFQNQFAIRQGMRPLETLNAVLWRIRQAIAGGALGRKDRMTICIAGYRARRGYTVPFLVELSWPDKVGPDVFRVRMPAHPRGSCLSQIGDGLPADELRDAMDLGAAAAPQTNCPPDIGAFVQAVRTRATQSDSVGADLMAIRIPGPQSRRIEWKFVAASAHGGIGPNGERLTNVSYSPWIVTPASISAPSLAVGGHFNLVFGEWEIACVNNDAPSPGGPLFAVSSQIRVPRP